MVGSGAYAEMLRTRFETACRRLGLNRRRDAFALDVTQFRPPPKKGDQLALF